MFLMSLQLEPFFELFYLCLCVVTYSFRGLRSFTVDLIIDEFLGLVLEKSDSFLVFFILFDLSPVFKYIHLLLHLFQFIVQFNYFLISFLNVFFNFEFEILKHEFLILFLL
jgi:hypothetical protein